MTKKKSFVMVLVAAVFALSCCVLSACATKYTVEWKPDANATINVTNETDLPTKVADGTELSFTVKCKDGWEVDKVTATIGTKENKVTEKNGAYAVTVSDNTVVTVTTKEVISKVEVTTPPTNVNYYEGEALDKTGMVVTVTYGTGRSEEVTDYTVTPETFSAGETSFTVNYKDKTSEPVTIPEVLARVLNFDGESASVALVKEGQKVFYAVTATYENYTKEQIEGLSFDFQEHGGYSGGSWTYRVMSEKPTVTVDATNTMKGTFTFKIDLAQLEEFWGTETTRRYLPHVAFSVDDHKDGGTAINVVTPIPADAKPVTVGGKSYTLTQSENETYGMAAITVTDTTAPAFTAAGLELKGGKPYLVLNGTCTITTTEADATKKLLEIINHLDLEDISNGNAKLTDFIHEGAITDTQSFFEFNKTANTFKLYLLLEGEAVQDGANFFVHLGKQGSDGYYPNLSLANDGSSIQYNGLTYSFTTAEDINLTESWQQGLLYINVKSDAAARRVKK